MKKKKWPSTRGPREKRITVRCVVCDGAFETTREDTLTCSPAHRKARSRWMAGKFVSAIVQNGTADENRPFSKNKGNTRGKANG